MVNDSLKNPAAGSADSDNVTLKKRARFLETLAETCHVSKSCEITQISRQTAYRWRRDDAEFAAKWKDALEMGADLLEEEAIRRAKDGVRRPVYQGGLLVGHVREYSDTLLIFLLKGAKPKKYGDRTTLAGDPKNPIQVERDFDRDGLMAKILGPAKFEQYQAARNGESGKSESPIETMRKLI
jgi:hypothetical protein